jgi:hypothetical protein
MYKRADASAGHREPMTPSAGPMADAAAGRTNGAMTRSHESSAMPMPGQNKDPSAPLSPAKSVSAP